MAELSIFVAAGLVTYAMRASFIVAGVRTVPPTIERALRHVKPAVLAALVAGSFLGPHGSAVDPAHVVALGVAVLVARRAGTIAVLGAGMVALWVISAVG